MILVSLTSFIPVSYIELFSFFTEGTFRPDRIRAIAERFNVDPTAALENIVWARAHNSEHRKFISLFEYEKIFLFEIIDQFLSCIRLFPLYCIEMELITNLAARFAEEQGVFRLLVCCFLASLLLYDKLIV